MISAECLAVLNACQVDSDKRTVTIPQSIGQLARPLYEEVNDVLERIGGKWNRRSKTHIFPYDPSPLYRAVLESRELPPKNPTAFFPTPKPVVDSMLSAISLCDFWDGARILEPSAGTGAIVTAIGELQTREQRKWTIDCCEVLSVNRAALVAQGHKLAGDDFLTYQPEKRYDAILMNPPFAVDGDAQAYITHIEHAWSMLRSGGTLAAIVPAGWIFGSSKKLTAFREFVCDSLDFEEIGNGAFKESGTLVNTYLIYGNKRHTSWRAQPYNGWCSYHAWNASLWIDNDFELYTSLRRVKDRKSFDSLCSDVVRKLLRDCIPIVLRPTDIDALWSHYHDSTDYTDQ